MKLGNIEIELNFAKPSHMAKYEKALKAIICTEEETKARKNESPSAIMIDDLNRMYKFVGILFPETEPEKLGMDKDNYDKSYKIIEDIIDEANRQIKERLDRLGKYRNLAK